MDCIYKIEMSVLTVVVVVPVEDADMFYALKLRNMNVL